MPPVLATVAFAAVLGLAWRWSRRFGAASDARPTEDRGPTEIIDAVPLVRGSDGVWRPDGDDGRV